MAFKQLNNRTVNVTNFYKLLSVK